MIDDGVAHVPFREALRYWLKLGFISFGGPAGQISLMHTELVERRRWISEQRFLHALNYCMVLPGPEAQQLATYIGWLMHGTWGGLVAGGLFVLPSLLILMGLSGVYMAFGEVPLVAGILYGIKPAVVAIVLAAAHRIGQKALKNEVLWGLAALSFVASLVFQVPFPVIVAAMAGIGVIGGRRWPAYFVVGGSGHGGSSSASSGGRSDKQTPAMPLPISTRVLETFSWSRSARMSLIFLGIWGGVLLLLVAWQGMTGLYPQLAWFFTKAALVTFGGAYAVLPYVYAQAVTTQAWLSPAQMVDGLALGETTPGPLIMVVAFVGFVAAWNVQPLGADATTLAAVLGAVVVTFFTFLPSFLFILVGAPIVEATRGNLQFTAPLTAITAAVVGVVLNMGMFFAYHVGWPRGFEGGVDVLAIVGALVGLVALVRFKVDIIKMMGVYALLGVALTLWRSS